MVFGNPARERRLIERTYDGLCTISEFQNVKDPETGRTTQKPVVVLRDQPCALSQTSLSSARRTATDNTIDYDAKLFLSPDITVKAGSRIRVAQHGMDLEFTQTGDPFRYPTHQEILLKRVGRA
ncbi:ABC transporter ATP-binding protein [Paenibacillus elgii]|uniref:ABC transporter ATP-binding protein n=1 Tax=Paenibacillus elgii TaxID=189691 RepID=UPI002041D185|nr:ABC transporter ATP-binding protein [Paenibacillus elgii]MCM3273664.1 ABC transporter ATP-binding protein [Paenibacillus elgii]